MRKSPSAEVTIAINDIFIKRCLKLCVAFGRTLLDANLLYKFRLYKEIIYCVEIKAKKSLEIVDNYKDHIRCVKFLK